MDPVTITDFAITGRSTAIPINVEPVVLTYNADFSSPSSIVFDFGQVNSTRVLGVIQSICIDNATNPNPVEVLVEGTEQFFTAPAYSTGYYKIDANQQSRIRLETQGGATEIVTVTLYNYPNTPFVWYSYGAINKDVPLKMQGANPNGTPDVDNTEFPNPVYLGGRGPTGELVALKVDALGRLDLAASFTIGGVFGADPLGGAPVNPGINLAAVDFSSGDLVQIYTSSNGLFVSDQLALAELVSANANLDSIENLLTGPSGNTTTSVAASITDVPILGVNANRKGGLIFNNSPAIMYVLFEVSGSSNTVFSTRVDAYGNFPIGNYTGAICATWAAATGDAKVSEFV